MYYKSMHPFVWWKRHPFVFTVAIVLLLTLCGLVVIYWYYSSDKILRLKRIRNCKRVLLVIAHPDDECLFFGPTILTMTSSRWRHQCDVYLLCLSSGNYCDKGKERKKELMKSCRTLGIPDDHVTIIDHTKLPDQPGLLWNRAIVKDIVLRYVEQLSVDTLLTFDDYGVSGHTNHRSIFRAIQHLYNKGKLPVNTQVFVLDSVSVFRKYAGFLDFLLSYWTSSFCFMSTFAQCHVIRRAMFQHRTQLAWFRVLYVVFSRYMFINTYKRIAMSENFYKYNDVAVSTKSNATSPKKTRSSTPP